MNNNVRYYKTQAFRTLQYQKDLYSQNKPNSPNNTMGNDSRSRKWIPGIVLQKLGPVTYQVEIELGQIVKHHVNQLQKKVDSQTLSGTGDSIADILAEDNYHYPEMDDIVDIISHKSINIHNNIIDLLIALCYVMFQINTD